MPTWAVMLFDVISENDLGLYSNSGADLGIVFLKDVILLFWVLTKAVFDHITAAVLDMLLVLL